MIENKNPIIDAKFMKNDLNHYGCPDFPNCDMLLGHCCWLNNIDSNDIPGHKG